MSSLPPEEQPHLPSLHVGMLFKSLEEGADAVTDAIVEAYESFKVLNRKDNFWAAICRNKDKYKCPFSVRISFTGKPSVCSLRILVSHTCPAESHQGWKRPHSVKYLARHNFELVANNRKIPPKLVADNERLQSGNKISYRQAHRTVQTVRCLIEGDEAVQFQYIRPLLRYIEDDLTSAVLSSEASYIKLAAEYDGASIKFKQNNDVFEAAAVFPMATRLTWEYCRSLLYLDGTHCSSKYGGILLLASTTDADENTLVLAWAIVPTESKEWWQWFLSFLSDDLYPTQSQSPRKLAIISDRGKGLCPAIEEYFPGAWHYWCTQHLAENVDALYLKEVTILFREAMQTTRKSTHTQLIEKIRTIQPAAVDYINSIGDKARYCTSYAPLKNYPRYGYITSNVGESMNSRFLKERKLLILLNLEAIWTYLMNTYYKRRTFTQKDHFTRFVTQW